MEHRRARTHEAEARNGALREAARAVCAERARPLRAGQVVSGRAAPALGPQSLLATRWRAALAKARAPGGRSEAERRERRDRRRVPSRRREAARLRCEVRLSGVRGRRLLPLAREPPSDQRRSERREARRSSRARATEASLRHGARRTGRVRPARRAQERREGTSHRPVALPRWKVFPRAGRFAARPAPAARVASVDRSEADRAERASRSVGGTPFTR